MSISIGKLLLNRYLVQEKLADDALTIQYLVMDKKNKQSLRLHVLKESTPLQVRLELQEQAILLNDLTHPNLLNGHFYSFQSSNRTSTPQFYLTENFQGVLLEKSINRTQHINKIKANHVMKWLKELIDLALYLEKKKLPPFEIEPQYLLLTSEHIKLTKVNLILDIETTFNEYMRYEIAKAICAVLTGLEPDEINKNQLYKTLQEYKWSDFDKKGFAKLLTKALKFNISEGYYLEDLKRDIENLKLQKFPKPIKNPFNQTFIYRFRKEMVAVSLLILFGTGLILTFKQFVEWNMNSQKRYSRARAELFTIQSSQHLEKNPVLSFHLARAAFELFPAFKTRQALYQWFYNAPLLSKSLKKSIHSWKMRSSKDNKYLITTSAQNQFHLWRFPLDKSNPEEFKGHQSGVIDIQYSPDGEHVLSASQDQTAGLWNLSTAKLIQEYRGHEAGLTLARFSPDGRNVLTAANDETMIIWDTNSGQKVKEIGKKSRSETSNKIVIHAEFSPDGKYLLTATGGYDKEIIVWSTNTWKPVKKLKHRSMIQVLKISPNGSYVAVGMKKGLIKIWDLSRLKPVSYLKGHKQAVKSLQFTQNGSRILSASLDGHSTLWDIRNGRKIKSYSLNEQALIQAVLSPDEQTVALAGFDGHVSIWHLKDEQPNWVIKASNQSLSDISFRSNQQLLTLAENEKVKIWNIPLENRMIRIKNLDHSPLRVWQDSPDSQKIATTGFNHQIALWSMTNGQLMKVFKGHQNLINDIHFSQDSQQILTSSFDRSTRLWNKNSSQALKVFKKHEDGVKKSVWAEDQEHVFTLGKDNLIRLWNRRGEKIGEYEHEFVDMAFQVPGTIFLISKDEVKRKIKSWDINQRAEIDYLKLSKDEKYLTHSNDLTLLATYNKEQKLIQIRDLKSGQIIRTIKNPDGSVYLGAFTSDNDRLIWQTPQKYMVYSLSNGKLNFQSEKNPRYKSFSFSPDNRYLLSSHFWEEKVDLWEFNSHKILTTFSVGKARFSQDGQYMIQVFNDNELRIIPFISNVKTIINRVENGRYFGAMPELTSEEKKLYHLDLDRDSQSLPFLK